MSGGGAETAAETAARSADSADSAETVDALQSAPPRDVVAAVAALRAAYDSTLAAALERCALAEGARRGTRPGPRTSRPRWRSSRGSSRRPPPPPARCTSAFAILAANRVTPFRGNGVDARRRTRSRTRRELDLEVELGRARDRDARRERFRRGAARRGRVWRANETRRRCAFFVRSSEDSSGASDASSGVSDEYGSVLSFATGVSHASHGSAGIARGSSDDLDLLVAEAAEVVNRHDFVISRKAEREDDEDSLDEDDADDASSVSSARRTRPTRSRTRRRTRRRTGARNASACPRRSR